MKVLKESTLTLFLITIIDAFLEPPFLRKNNSPLDFNSLYIEKTNIKTVNKELKNKSLNRVRIPIGGSHREFVKFPRTHYVDKTLFIRDVLHDSFYPITVISRPHGFGKTLALSSLYCFCDYTFKNATELFSGLKIMEKDPISDVIREEFMSKIPVIWIDFATVKYATFAQNFEEIRKIISDTFRMHKYVLQGETMSSFYKEKFQKLLLGEANKFEVANSLVVLCEGIIKVYSKEDRKRKPIILIDNYDVPFHTGYKYDFFEKMERFIQGLFVEFGQRRFAQKIVLTTVTGIAENEITLRFTFDRALQITVLTPQFFQHFGFTSEEVQELLKRRYSDVPQQTLTGMATFHGKRYGGYLCYTSENVTVFNPLSIINEIFSNKHYQWNETESKEPLGKLIVEHGFYPLLTIQQLLIGEQVEKIVAVDVNFLKMKQLEFNYWSYLVHSGYMTAIKAPWKGKSFSSLRIPNLEVNKRVESLIKEYSKKIPLYTEFTDLLVNGSYPEAKNFILEYIQSAGEYFRGEQEDFNLNKLRKYVQQMLLGVEIRYNTKMKKTEKLNGVTFDIEDPKEEGKAVKVTVQKIDTSEKSWDNLAGEICSVFRSVEKKNAEIIINITGKTVNVCLNYFLKNVF